MVLVLLWPHAATAASGGVGVRVGTEATIHIVITKDPDTAALTEQLAKEIRRALGRAHYLKGRLRVQMIDPMEGPSASLPSESMLQAARDATFLLWGVPNRAGGLSLFVAHMYALPPAYQSLQAEGSGPIVPIVHRLPDFHADDPVQTVYALLGISYIRQGNYKAALQVLSALNETPGLAPAARYPTVFFIALSELLIGLAGDDARQVDQALYHFGAIETVAAKVKNAHLLGATLVNMGLALQLHPQRQGPVARGLAIAAFESALSYYTATSTPIIHARIMHQLATAEQRMPTSRDGYHLHRAITAYKRALRVWSPDTFPEAFRSALHNMALCFQRLPVGDRKQNLDNAIRLYRQILSMPQLTHRPDLVAATFGNLGQAYQSLPHDPTGASIRRAIAAYREALRYWDKERDPQQFARIHQLAGMAFQLAPTGDRRENLLQAIRHYDQALRVITKKKQPMQWGLIQIKRGVLFSILPAPGVKTSLLHARQAFELALTVVTADNLPYYHAKVVKNLEQVNARLEEADR